MPSFLMYWLGFVLVGKLVFLKSIVEKKTTVAGLSLSDLSIRTLVIHLITQRKTDDSGSASVEFMFAFLLLFWMCLGFIDVVFQGYNGLMIDYGSYIGSRGYIVDEPGGTRWREGAETVGLGTMQHTDIQAYRNGDKVVLEVTNKEMLKSGILYGSQRKGTISIGNNLGEQEEPFSGDNAPY